MRASGDYTVGAGMADPLSNFWYSDPDKIGPSGPDAALTIGAVFRAVEILANNVAKLPLKIYQRIDAEDGDREAVQDHPVAKLLGQRPNPWQTPFEFRQMLTGHLVLRGNAYARILPGEAGFAGALIPLDPSRMDVEQLDTYRLRYTYLRKNGTPEVLTQDEVMHLRGFSTDGLLGRSRVSQMRATVSLAKDAEDFGARQFERRPMMSGVLKHPGKFKDTAAQQRVRESFQSATAGRANWHGVAVLEDGLEWQQVGMSNADAEFLATRKFQKGEIATWFGVPPHLLGDLERATFSNIEHQSIDFVTFSLSDWLSIWEGVIERDLILEPDRYFAEFKLDALLRGDTLSRFNAYKVALGGRAFMSPDEVRSLENLNKRGGQLDEIHEGLGSTSPAPGAASDSSTPMSDQNAPDAEDPAPAPDAKAPRNRVKASLNGHRRK